MIYLEFSGDTRPGQQSKKPGYFLTGDGLDKGQCGLKINRVEDTDNGVWQCTLLTSSGSQRGQVHLSILRKSYMHKISPLVKTTPSFKLCLNCCFFLSFQRNHLHRSTSITWSPCTKTPRLSNLRKLLAIALMVFLDQSSSGSLVLIPSFIKIQ